MPPSGGVIGSKAATTFTEYWNSTTYTYTSAFTPTTAGQVSYIYFDVNPANTNPAIMTNARVVIVSGRVEKRIWSISPSRTHSCASVSRPMIASGASPRKFPP